MFANVYAFVMALAHSTQTNLGSEILYRYMFIKFLIVYAIFATQIWLKQKQTHERSRKKEEQNKHLLSQRRCFAHLSDNNMTDIILMLYLLEFLQLS